MTDAELSEVFGTEQKPPAYDFNGHVVTVVLLQGKGEPCPELRFECKEASLENSPCTPHGCMMEDLYKQVGWDVISCAGEIDLVRLSARVDWSDPEEPWIEVEP